MKNTRWTKLYSTLGDHPVIADAVALQILIWLFTKVDENGERTIGRHQLAVLLNQPPSTLRNALKRLTDKYQIIDTSVTRKFTTIRLRNWSKYQVRVGDEDRSRTEVGQNEDTRIRKDNISNTYVLPNRSTTKKDTYGNENVEKILKKFEFHIGRIPSDKKPRNVAYNISQLINTFLKHNGKVYSEIKGRELTFDYVLDKAWEWFMLKDYAQTVENIETFKLKMKVFLDETEKKLNPKGGVYEYNTETN